MLNDFHSLFAIIINGSIAILAFVAGATVRAAMGYHYPQILQSVLGHRRLPKGLLGKWHSEWQTNENDKVSDWTSETVTITQIGWELLFKNEDNIHGYEFVGKGRYLAPHIIFGSYQSITIPKSDGAFILLYQDAHVVGFFLGPGRDNYINFGAWVMAKNKETLSTAKAYLGDHGPTLQEIFTRRRPLSKVLSKDDTFGKNDI